ncbi:MAG: hypothetical protein M0P16_00460 [Syntrophales bacterium]|jgi:hypothetical protein|nr:hypothetical protein [Syntrophales bacterium]MCK9390257.1 hypothetical protein [Syntrophales bacterium]
MLNPTEEKKYAELKTLCVKLKVPSPPEIMIGLKVHDKNGILIIDDIQRGHSWTRNFWNLFYAGFNVGPLVLADSTFGAGYANFKDNTAGVHAQYASGQFEAKIGIISVGTADTAFDIDQYTLAAAIEDGTSSGQLSHVAQAAAISAYTSGTQTWKTTVARIFNNNSGGSITIKEVGINNIFYVPSYGARTVLMERSILSPTVAVPNGAQLTVTYEISMDFSAID